MQKCLKMLNTPAQVEEAKKALEKVKDVQSKEAGVEGVFLDALIPIIQKLALASIPALIEWLQHLPKPSPNTAEV